MTGRVKFYNADKGFGFISPDDGQDDVFVHFTHLAEGQAQLVEGERVEFDVRVEFDARAVRKGREAVNVRHTGVSPPPVVVSTAPVTSPVTATAPPQHAATDGHHLTGVVKWFNAEKGFGFLTPDDGSGDVFVHYSAIEGTGYTTLGEGERVEFDVQPGRKGREATNVRRASTVASPVPVASVTGPGDAVDRVRRAVATLSGAADSQAEERRLVDELEQLTSDIASKLSNVVPTAVADLSVGDITYHFRRVKVGPDVHRGTQYGAVEYRGVVRDDAVINGFIRADDPAEAGHQFVDGSLKPRRLHWATAAERARFVDELPELVEQVARVGSPRQTAELRQLADKTRAIAAEFAALS